MWDSFDVKIAGIRRSEQSALRATHIHSSVSVFHDRVGSIDDR